MPKPTKSVGKLPPVKVSVLRKATVQMFFVTAFTAAALSLCSFVVARAQMQRQMLSQLSSIAQNRKYLLEQRFKQDKERIALLGIDRLSRDVIEERISARSLEEQIRLLQRENASIIGLTIYMPKKEPLYVLGTNPNEDNITQSKEVQMETGASDQITYVITVPVQSDDGMLLGQVAVRYALDDFITVLYASPGIGQTEDVILGSLREDEIILIMDNPISGGHAFLEVGSFRNALQANMPIAGAIAQSDGTIIGYDYAGRRVLAAYAGIEGLQWGLVVKIEHDEAMQTVFRLAFTMIAVSLVLIALAALTARIFARSLTNPIIQLCNEMKRLGPPNWEMKKILNTGDEIEVLEHVIADMASRLKGVYEYMEDEIDDRTKALKKQYLKDRAILQAIDYGVVLTDEKGTITDANPAALDFLMCTEEKCTGVLAEQVLNIQMRQKTKAFQHPITQTLKTKKPVHSSPDLRFSILRSDSILIPVILSCVPLMDGKRLMGSVLIFQDATEQRRVDYLKSEFISLASHQLRTPLSSIQWYVELFSEEKGMSKIQKEYLHEMKVAASRMTGLIDALLHAARLETGNITPHASSVNVTTLLTDLGDELRSMGKKKGIACTVTLPKKKVLMETDSVLMHVVFKNLFSNAIKYTNQGGKVGVTMKDTKTGIEITVTDTGIGIPKKEQKRLFERLFRASNVKKMDTDGNGLGLYITKMIVSSLGGSVSVLSAENKGTTVTLKLPKTMKKTKK